MHPGKTELILFGSKSKLKKIKQFKVNCEGFVTEASTCVKYLGLDLDQTLSGEATVNTIVNKVNSRVKFLYRQAKYLDTKTKLTIASALILSHFDYSIASWYCGLTKSLQHKLQAAQNRVIRFILDYSPRTHISRNDFRITRLLNVEDRAKQIRLNHMYNIFHNICPPYMQHLFIRVNTMYRYSTCGNLYNKLLCTKG